MRMSDITDTIVLENSSHVSQPCDERELNDDTNEDLKNFKRGDFTNNNSRLNGSICDHIIDGIVIELNLDSSGNAPTQLNARKINKEEGR